jgi:hypothetical protein
MAKKRVAKQRKQAVMKITARKGQVIRELAQEMGTLIPATAYGTTFCFRVLARELGLAKYWREKHNKTETISHFLQQVFRYRPRMPFKIVREVVSRGVERGRRMGVPVTRQHLDRIDGSLCELGYDMHAEIAKVKLDEVTAQAVAPSKEMAQILKRLGLHPAGNRHAKRTHLGMRIGK